MTSLLGRLLRSSPGLGKENSFTEAVAILFEKRPRLCLAWLKEEGLIGAFGTEKVTREDANIVRQKWFSPLENHGNRASQGISTYEHTESCKISAWGGNQRQARVSCRTRDETQIRGPRLRTADESLGCYLGYQMDFPVGSPRAEVGFWAYPNQIGEHVAVAAVEQFSNRGGWQRTDVD